MPSYREFHRRSIAEREAFWAEQARLVHWNKPSSRILDYSRPPFARWFVGGETNLCYNAVDRHLAARGDQKALVWISTEVDKTQSFTYRQLHAEVNRVAAMMRSLGVKRADRVIVYLPNMPEAVFAILACARIGAIHSVVFGGFAAASLAARIDDAKPALMVTADAGSRMGKIVRYKPLVDEAIGLSKHPPRKVLIFNRGLDPAMPLAEQRDIDWKTLAEKHGGTEVACTWLESNEPSYILYTSGTTGRAKGVLLTVHGMLWIVAACWAPIAGLSERDTMLSPLPLFHSYALNLAVLAVLATGASEYIMERFSTSEAVRLLKTGEFTYFPGVPTMFHY
ncbi:MAG: AMP-binding protein, partial [Burkholderiales bacterium]